ncbi:MAG: hypothetical protein N2B05_00595, partial [Gemmatimonadales bacterium]
MSILHVADLFEQRQKSLDLTLAAGQAGLTREITSSDISSPGLVLAGFTDRFPSGRMQVLGETEVMYLRSMDADRRRHVLGEFLGSEV